MSEILLVCLMVLVVIGNTSGRWTKKSEEDPKDFKNEKENMKEVSAHRQENNWNKRFTTTTSTSTMPPTTTTKFIQYLTAIDEIEQIKEEMRKERKESFKELEDEMNEIKKEMRVRIFNRVVHMSNERKIELEKNQKESKKKLLNLCDAIKILKICQTFFK